MRRTGTFRLADVIAVLAVVAITLPLLASSIEGMKARSHLEICRANLKGLARSVVAYAERNAGYMPVYRHRYIEGSAIVAPESPNKTTIAFTVSPINPYTGLYSDARNFGLQYVRGDIGPAGLFYCPSPRTDIRHMLASYPKPWGSRPASGTQWVRTGYMWNPWVAGFDSSYYFFEDGLSLEQHPAGRFLVSDLVYSMNVTCHFNSDPYGASWNFAYPDGSVRTIVNPSFFSYFVAGSDMAPYWSQYNQLVRPELEAFGASQ